MGDRYLPNSSRQMFGTDQDHYQSHLTAQRSHIHLGRYVAPGNAPMFRPMENTPISRAFCASQRGLEYRLGAHSLSNVRLESPPLLQGTRMEPAFDPFPQFSVVGRSYQAPANNSAHAHTSYYASHSMHEVSGIVDPTTGTRRGSFKRKGPSISVASERGRSTFYGAGSSYSSSEIQLKKSTYQTSEEFQRNVRSRSRLDLEPTPRANYFHHYSQTTNLTNQTGAAGVTNFSAVRTIQEHNHAMLFQAAHENNGLNQEMNLFPLGAGTAQNGGHCHDSISRRNFVLPPHRQNAPSHAVRNMNSSCSRRAIPSYQAGSSFSSLRRETVPSQIGLPYRHTRPPSARGWCNSYRDERSRMHIHRSEPLSNAVCTRDGLGSEAFMSVDHSSLYTSRNLFDQYTDMRIDVDNMSYEELLALEERIGNVNIGLSGDMISKCLETRRSSSDHNLNEKCAICLEEYKMKEEVGTIKNCGHRYHAGCIKKWLSMKNACPICKAPALSDNLKEQTSNEYANYSIF